MVRTVMAILVLALGASPLSAQPKIEFEKDAVVAHGATPGGSVVWFGVVRDRPGWTNRVVRRDALVTDSDGDGDVRLDLGLPVAPQSIWAAVDLTSGAVAVATPEGMPRREVELPVNALRSSARGVVEAVEDSRQFLEILVVRPGEGSWTISVGDGGASDDDRQSDGNIRAALATMRPAAATKTAPSQLLPGDVVVVVDPRLMEFYVTTFGRAR
jgi:hypothetical protein